MKSSVTTPEAIATVIVEPELQEFVLEKATPMWQRSTILSDGSKFGLIKS